MKITVRIPMPEPYAYNEVQFDSLEEYRTSYPQVAQAIIETRQKIKKMMEPSPFTGTEFTK